jgi:hypothetical protein
LNGSAGNIEIWWDMAVRATTTSKLWVPIQ